jgi:hypothetical protein
VKGFLGVKQLRLAILCVCLRSSLSVFLPWFPLFVANPDAFLVHF